MEEFWNIAYRDNAPALKGVLRRYVKDADIVQDLLHEVFISAISKYGSYTGKGSFEGWMYRIAVNTALMHIRNVQNRQAVMDFEAADAANIASPSDDSDYDGHPENQRAIIEAADFSNEELLAAIDRLPEHHKSVFNMYVMDGFSHKQIGEELNISAGTSKSHMKRARKKVQQFLYEDAMNKKKKKDRQWASALLLLLPARERYIDRLYRERLSNFKIPPTGSAEFISTALEQQAASFAKQQAAQMATHSATFWGGKLSYMAACCGTAAVVIPVCWLSMSVNSPMNKENSEVIEHIFVNDTLKESGSSTVDTFQENNEAVAAPPVVVKRQIIEHQTVVVRDTIFIMENE